MPSLLALLHGVVRLENHDGFPQESRPPKGKVTVTFGNRESCDVTADIDEFRAANYLLRMRNKFSVPEARALAEVEALEPDRLD